MPIKVIDTAVLGQENGGISVMCIEECPELETWQVNRYYTCMDSHMWLSDLYYSGYSYEHAKQWFAIFAQDYTVIPALTESLYNKPRG